LSHPFVPIFTYKAKDKDIPVRDGSFFETIQKIEARYPDRRSALLPALYLLQEKEGYITPEGMQALADHFGLSPMAVYEVATFYTMLRLQAVGNHHIQVCTNLSCSLLGGQHAAAYIAERLGISVGETTSDGAFTLSTAECLGSCGTAPMMQVNDLYYENLTRAKIDSILDGLKDKEASYSKRPGPDGF
jgi:NADH-quinone oxidoreductase subunit E